MKTFVVRLVVPVENGPAAGGDRLNGFVEESASGRTARFESGAELVRFLATAAGGRQRLERPAERRVS